MKRIMIRKCKSENEIEQRDMILLQRTRRRKIANALERGRVRRLNKAFSLLRESIPYCDAKRIRTKFDVLTYAIEYIRLLRIMARVQKTVRREPQGEITGCAPKEENR